MQLTGAQIVMECLIEQGVDTIFGYPGGTILNVYDELYKYQDKINHVLTSHEQGAAHAADGYARATGKVGVCMATSGPGATNLVTGIATAYMDSIPLVAITCNVAVSLLGKDSFQEVDVTGVTMPITKHNFIVKDVNKLADTLRRAFEIAREGRPGPVLVDIAKDVTANKCSYERVAPTEIVRSTENITEEDIDQAVKAIKASKKPMCFVGGGCVLSDADEELAKYGLDEPQYNLEVKYTPKSEDSSEDSGDSTDSKAGSSEKTFILHVSAKQDDKAYVRIGDSKIIYEITEDEYKNVTDGSYDSLRHKSVVTANLSDVDSVKVTLEDKDYTIDLSEKKGDVVSTYDGEEIEGTDFTDALKALKASDFTSEEPSEKEEISFTLHYKDDKYPEKEVKIYRYDGTNCLVTIDGKSISLVKRDLVVDLTEAVNAIVLK